MNKKPFFTMGLKSVLVGFLLILVSCSSHRPRDPNIIYLDEVKYTQKRDTSFIGLFTTQPVTNFSADKVLKPLSLVVNMDAVNVSDVKFPKRFKDDAIISFKTNTERDVQGRQYGQLIVYLKKDIDFAIKSTEYGLRLDIKEGSGAVANSAVPEASPTPSLETPKNIDLDEVQKTHEQDELARDEDMKELQETEKESKAPTIETPIVHEPEPAEPQVPEPDSPISPTPFSKKKLDSITRTSIDGKERIILTCSEPIEFQKSVLDKEAILELKNVQLGPSISDLTIHEENSFLTQITPSFSDSPYASTKVTFYFKDSIAPKITQSANLIYVDLERPKLAKRLEDEEEYVIDFGNYLISPSKLPGRKISLEAKETDIRDILRLLAETSDYNIIVGQGVSGKVTIRLIKVPWDEALIGILQSQGLGFVKQGNIIRIATLTALKEEKEKAVEALNAKDLLEPLQVLFIPISHKKAQDLVRHLYPFLSERGSLSIDRSSNTIIMRDISGVLTKTSKFVSSLDVKK